MQELRQLALVCLIEPDLSQKIQAVHSLNIAWQAHKLVLDTSATLPVANSASIPGRPDKPLLVLPKNVQRRRTGSKEGLAALVHAIAHIEFNAINLALDAIWRFAEMPAQYYTDWLKVATEEAYHFTLLHEHLKTLGYDYGYFDAHNGLWEMAQSTEHDILARMALVPRTLEARGLDVTPAIKNKFEQAGDLAAAAILDIILRDEIGHVAIGNHWFYWLCEQRKLAPIEAYQSLAKQYHAPLIQKPINIPARLAAGFSEQELNSF